MYMISTYDLAYTQYITVIGIVSKFYVRSYVLSVYGQVCHDDKKG